MKPGTSGSRLCAGFQFGRKGATLMKAMFLRLGSRTSRLQPAANCRLRRRQRRAHRASRGRVRLCAHLEQLHRQRRHCHVRGLRRAGQRPARRDRGPARRSYGCKPPCCPGRLGGHAHPLGSQRGISLWAGGLQRLRSVARQLAGQPHGLGRSVGQRQRLDDRVRGRARRNPQGLPHHRVPAL